MKQFQEVAPPGWGHTKAEKEKTDPSKPKSKIGGSAAAFDRARKEGRFKGSKEDMFKLMWWMKNKGGKPKGKPHYKPGTDEKYKKYQDKDETNESVMPNVKSKDKAAIKARYKGLFKKDLKGNVAGVNESSVVLEKDLNAAERRALPDSDFALPGKGEGPKGKQAGSYPIPDEKHARSALSLVAQHGTPAEKATVRAKVKKKFPNIEQSESVVLDANTKIKKDEKKKKQEAELRRLLQHAIAVKKGQAESFEIDKSAHKKVQKKAKLRNLAKGNMNPNEKAAAEKKAGGPKLAFEGWQERAREAMRKVAGKKPPKKHDYGRDAGKIAKELMRKKDHQSVNFLDPDD